MPWIKIAPKLTVEAAAYCEQFAPHLPDEAALYSLRRYMDGKGFFKGKGFTFGLIACALNEWAMTREPAPQKSSAPPPPALSEEERQRKSAEMAAKKAELLAQLAQSAQSHKRTAVVA